MLGTKTHAGSITYYDTPWVIGRIYFGGAGLYHFDGLIDEVAMFDRALSPAEVEELYDNSLAGDAYCELSQQEAIPEITGTTVLAIFVAFITALLMGAFILHHTDSKR